MTTLSLEQHIKTTIEELKGHHRTGEVEWVTPSVQNDFRYFQAGAKYMQRKVLSILTSVNNYDNPMTLNDCIDAIQALLPGPPEQP